MNYIATYFISFLLFGILKDAKGWNYPQTSEVASQLRFHTLFGTRANIGILISLATAVFAWYVFQKTKFGFLINTIGGNVIVNVKESRVAISKEMAQRIMV